MRFGMVNEYLELQDRAEKEAQERVASAVKTDEAAKTTGA
jgi:hypothetical protein